MKLLVLDSESMVGHVVALYHMEHGHEVYGYGNGQGTIVQSYFGSLYDTEKLQKIISDGDFDAVINCSAIINQNAERDKAEAVFINAYLPHFLEKITEGSKTVIVHRGTDCVFSGRRGAYTVNDMPDADSFYAKTKAVGVLINSKDIAIRTSLIGPEMDADGSGLFNWFMKQAEPMNGYRNAIWTGITTIEFAKEIEYLLIHKHHGLLQCVPSTPISKYDLLCLFKARFKPSSIVVPYENSRVDKSLVPYLGESKREISSYETQLDEMSRWIDRHRELYGHYL